MSKTSLSNQNRFPGQIRSILYQMILNLQALQVLLKPDLFKDIEAVFTNLQTHYGMAEDKNIIQAKFENEFKPEIVSIEWDDHIF